MSSSVTAPMRDRRRRRTASSGSRWDRCSGRNRSQFGGVEVAWLLGRLTVRRWAVALGTTDGGLVLTAAALLGGLAVAGAVVADRWSAPAAGAPVGAAGPAESVLLGGALGVWALAAAFGVFVSHAATVPPTLRFLRTLPVSPPQVARAAALPLVVLALGAVVAAGPLAVTVTTASTGRGTVHAVTLLSVIAVSGVALGMILHRAAARLLAAPGWGSLRLTTAYLGWCLAAVISLIVPLPLLQRLGPSLGLAVLAPLGWPMAWWALLDPTPVALLGATAVAVALATGAARLRPPSPEAERARTAVRRLAAGRPLPVLRVQLRRLARHPRVLEAVVVAGFFGLVLVVAAGWLARRLPGSLSPTVVALLGAQIAAAPAALARGLSERRRPIEAALGIRPSGHVVSLFGASLALCAIAAAPALAASLVLLPASVAAGWLAALPLLVAVGVGGSCLLTPELGNGSAEGGAVLTYAAVAAAVVALVDHLPAQAVGAAPKLALAALAAATALERAHRRPT